MKLQISSKYTSYSSAGTAALLKSSSEVATKIMLYKQVLKQDDNRKDH